MTDSDDWNTKVIAEFRANEGQVSGPFEGAPMVLLHHRGRKSGREFITPTMYMADEQDPDLIYVFASKSGAPTNPDWFYNFTAAGTAEIERGTDTYQVTVVEVTDIGLLLWSVVRATEGVREQAPEAWRRHLGVLLDGLHATAAHPLPGPPLGHETLRTAMRLGN